MSQRIPLALVVAAKNAAAVTSMARRVTDQIVDVDHCQALITDDPSLAISAATAGTPTLVMDPFRLPQATRSQLAELPTMPAHTARFVPSMREVQQASESGRLGDPGLLRIHLWRGDRNNARDLLAEQLDLAIWLFGRQSPSITYAVSRPGYTQVHLGFAAGGMALIDLDTSLPAGNDYYALSLIGSTGAAYADDHHNTHLLWDSRGAHGVRTEEAHVALRYMLADFVEAIVGNQALPVGWGETEAALRAVEEVTEAAEQQLVVRGGTDG